MEQQQASTDPNDRTAAAETREVGNQRVRDFPMDMGGALSALRAGKRITRKGWNGRDQYLELQVPDDHSKMTLPYVYIRTVQGDLVPWLCSQTDLLANDWVIVA